MKKTFVAGALAFTMAAAFLSGCGSNTQTKAANRLEEIQQRGYIEVATEPYFAPNEFIDSLSAMPTTPFPRISLSVIFFKYILPPLTFGVGNARLVYPERFV